MNKKRLTKSKTDKKIFGVCGGIAEYFDIDSTWVRLAVTLLILGYGSGLLIYIVAALVMPEASAKVTNSKVEAEVVDEEK